MPPSLFPRRLVPRLPHPVAQPPEEGPTRRILMPGAMRGRNWRLLCGPPILFLILSAVFLWQPISTGQVLLPTDLSYQEDPVWQGRQRPPALPVAQNPLLSDVANYYYPYARYAMTRLQAGHFPLWNPYILTGTPFFAAAQAAVLDPVNLLTYPSGPDAYWTWAAWLRLALLGWTMYGLLRALGRGVYAGIGAGVVFMVCGFVTVWLNYSVVTMLAWVPGLFWATTRALQTGRRSWLAATAITWGLILLGGHPETQFLTGLAWGVYVLYHLAFGHRADDAGTAWGRGLALAGAAGLGLALAAVQWLPFVDLLLHSSAVADRAALVAPFSLGESALRLIVLIFPNFAGTPREQNYWVPGWLNFNEQTGYIGLLALPLAGLGAVYWARRDRLAPFWAGLGVLALLLAIRAPGFHLIRMLPVFDVGHGIRWTGLWGFCGAVLVGYGLDALLILRPRTLRLRAAGYLFALTALLALGVLLGLYVGIRGAGWDTNWQAAIGHSQIVRLFDPIHRTLYWPLLFLGGAALVVLARWLGWLREAATILLLIALLYADLWTFGSRYNPVTPAAAVYPATPITDYLVSHAGHDRIVGALDALGPNVPMVFGLRDVRGYEDVVDQSFARLYGPALDHLNIVKQKALRLTPAQQRLLKLAGVRYMVTPRRPRMPGQPDPYRWVAEAGPVAVYEDPQALPRAYVVFNAQVLPDSGATAEALLAPGYDPRRTVLLAAGGPPLAGSALDLDAAPVRWERDDPEQIAVAATLPAPGYLVLGDAYAAGWEATVDGQAAPLLRANGVYRAVALAAGAHRVEFTYRPGIVTAGAAISGLAVLVLLGLLFAGRRRAAAK